MSAVTENDLKRLEDLIVKGFEKVEQRFEKVDQRFEQIDQRFEKIDQRFEKIDQRLDELKKGQDALQNDFSLIKGKLSLIEPAFQNLPALTEKIGELKNWKTITVGIIALILGIFLRGIYNQP